MLDRWLKPRRDRVQESELLKPDPVLPLWVVAEPARKIEASTVSVEALVRSLFEPFFANGNRVDLDGHALTLEHVCGPTGVLGAWMALAELRAQEHGTTFVTHWEPLGGLVGLMPVAWDAGRVDVTELLVEVISPWLKKDVLELSEPFLAVSHAAGMGALRGLPPCVLAWRHPLNDAPAAGAMVDNDAYLDPQQWALDCLNRSPRVLGPTRPSNRAVLRREGTPPMRESDLRVYNQLMEGLSGGLPVAPWPLPTVWSLLRKEFPWALDACQTIEMMAELASYVKQPVFRLPPLLLVGSAGCGKTRFAQRLANLAGVDSLGLSGAGKTNGHVLAGVDRAWSNSQPSALLQFMIKKRTANPVVVLDELDKAAQDTKNGDLVAALLPFLEPESARSINDDFLMAELDYSGLSWIATANDASILPAPLLSRFKVIEVGRPRAEHLPLLCESVREDLAAQYEVPVENLPKFRETDLARIKKGLGMSFSAREVRLACESLLAEKARQNRLGVVRSGDIS